MRKTILALALVGITVGAFAQNTEKAANTSKVPAKSEKSTAHKSETKKTEKKAKETTKPATKK